MRFRTTLLLHGKTATGIQVPVAVVQELGAGRKPAVLVTIAADPAAAAFFASLSYSHQRAHAEPIAQAAKPETRARRVAKTMGMLRAGRKR